MSGPKRARIRFIRRRNHYDPTAKRLADLETAATKLDQWLTRHGESLVQYLGQERAEEAYTAYGAVLDYAAARRPDEGFDAYGQAWRTFNRLWREADRARQELRNRARAEKRQRRTEQKQQANLLIEECREMWLDPEAKRTLKRWGPKEKLRSLGHKIRDLETGPPRETTRKAADWQEEFDRILGAAHANAEANAQRVATMLPDLRARFKTLDEMDLSVLQMEDRPWAEHNIAMLRAEADAAVSEEDFADVKEAVQTAQEIVAELRGKIDRSQSQRAAEVWQTALKELGYSVEIRKDDPSGAIVIEASSFPMRSLTATFQPDSDEVGLNVNGDYDSTQCVSDIGSIQRMLARHGLEFAMTDWGRANPQARNAQSRSLQQTLGGDST